MVLRRFRSPPPENRGFSVQVSKNGSTRAFPAIGPLLVSVSGIPGTTLLKKNRSRAPGNFPLFRRPPIPHSVPKPPHLQLFLHIPAETPHPRTLTCPPNPHIPQGSRLTWKPGLYLKAWTRRPSQKLHSRNPSQKSVESKKDPKAWPIRHQNATKTTPKSPKENQRPRSRPRPNELFSIIPSAKSSK